MKYLFCDIEFHFSVLNVSPREPFCGTKMTLCFFHCDPNSLGRPSGACFTCTGYSGELEEMKGRGMFPSFSGIGCDIYERIYRLIPDQAASGYRWQTGPGFICPPLSQPPMKCIHACRQGPTTSFASVRSSE